MKAEELRINNWVKDENGHYQIKGEHLDEDNFPTIQTWEIPLTKEWLLKFGFDEHAIGYYNKDFIIFLSYSNTGLHQYRLRDFNTIIKYVHQLQNLYFALTGEELTLKDNL